MNVLLWIGQVRQSITAVSLRLPLSLSFNAIGTPVTAAETRAHMGLTKVEEIRALFNIDRVRNEFQGNTDARMPRKIYWRAMQTFSVCCLPLWKIIQHLFPVWLKRYRDCVHKRN